MTKLVIEGGTRLKGKVNISGFKNAALAIIAGTILSDKKCVIENLPVIQDVIVYKNILKKLGAEVDFTEKGTLTVDGRGIRDCNLLMD